MFKKGKWADTFLQKVWEVYPEPKPWYDQASMAYVLCALSPEEKHREGGCRTNTAACCHSHVIEGAEVRPPKDMNAFKPGEFILHVPGGEPNQKLGKLKRFAQLVLLPA